MKMKNFCTISGTLMKGVLHHLQYKSATNMIPGL